MDQYLIEQWNRTVPEDATVFHLGDVSFRPREHTRAILRLLNGRKHLLVGNHDKGLLSAIRGEFESVNDYLQLRFGYEGEKHRIVLCHYPFRSWVGMGKGDWNLHGHSHGNLPQRGKQLDVGVDCWDFRPVSFFEIQEKMQSLPIYTEDHH